jgi:anti-sigma-K factor RskA
MESGILELYVLGQLNAQEKAEVEEMAANYPEVKQEIEAIEIAMEQYALLNAVAPSTEMENSILEKINIGKGTTAKDPVIIPLNNSIYKSKIRSLRLALAACAALLVVSLIALYAVQYQLGRAKDQIASLNLEKEKFASTVNFMKQTNTDLRKIADMMNDPNWKAVKLAGTKMNPDAQMVVYWHVTGKHVMMDNSKMKLPANDPAHQYQLWALVNGKPIDLGVFDVKTDRTQILVNMKEIAGAKTFAVTLENRGGSATPTMSQMIVAGNVSI